MCVTSHPAAVVVDEDVSCHVVLQVGDLQAVGVSDLIRLEAGVDAVHLYNSFGFLSLQIRSIYSVKGVCPFQQICNVFYFHPVCLSAKPFVKTTDCSSTFVYELVYKGAFCHNPFSLFSLVG